MDWSLGTLMGDAYVVSANALDILEEINYKLTYEHQTLRTFRRAIGFGQNIRADLIPLLENTKDEEILDLVIRILVNLTVPVECLFSVDIMYRTDVGRNTIFELNRLLHSSKEAFTDPKSTKSVVEYMKYMLESESKLSAKKCDRINNCLLLLRNILHIPELNVNYLMPTTSHCLAGVSQPVSMQNAILWNLFIQSIDKLLLYLMTCPQRAIWGVTMVQLIALIYKDQHASTLQKLLNLWFEASLSESSEDNESNTSPPKQGSCDSSPMLTSDPTSDSSDNGSAGCKNGNSEDRRQALREETEATLHEVSRKGQEYQDYMLRVPADNSSEGASDIGATDCEKVQQRINTTIQKIDKEEAIFSDGTVTSISIHKKFEIIELMNEQPTKTNQINKQPVEPDSNTSNVADEAHYMPPPALPIKTLISAQTSTHKIIVDPELMVVTQKILQKSPNSGLIKLTNGNCGPQKRECPSSPSELSDCGYSTQVENQESISTSSNDDDSLQRKPPHQKPPCSSKPRNKPRILLTPFDKKELRRKKLVKRSKSSLINMKGLVLHTPTDDDISNLLKEFTVDFLLKGYGHLVEELHIQLLTNMNIPIDTSHFFWLVTYFLKFAAQLELDMEHVNTILTYDVFSYLTYEGVMLCEQLDLDSRQEGHDLKPYLRRMHLVVTAIREFLQAIETYKKASHLSDEDRELLRQLQLQISATEDLRNLFVLLLRRFNPSLHSMQYLQDLVVTNHLLLLILDNVTKSNSNVHIKMIDHISQFATLEIMHYYGMLLEDFNSNGEFVNNCIFTMMHHIGGDLRQIGTLFQPVILKTFSRIWEANYELCDDWSDLIEYVIHKFMNTPQKSPIHLPSTSLTELTKEHNMETTECNWTQEEMDILYWYYVKSKNTNDISGKIVQLFRSNCNMQKSRIAIIQQLLQQDIITLVEYDDLMKFEDAECQRTLLTTPTSSAPESESDLKETFSTIKPSDDIQILRDLIISEKKQKHLVWLQKLLLECCYIKLILEEKPLRDDHKSMTYLMEPVAYHSILKNKSIPIVEWNNEQATAVMYQPFVLLLHKLGFQLPADTGSVFGRIPDSWTPEMMFKVAKKLGPLEELNLKFDIHQFDIDKAANVNNPVRSHTEASVRSKSFNLISSIDVDIIENDELATIPEIDENLERTSHACEIFAVPNTKHCNSIIRYTPEPKTIPTIPNWLQIVLRRKCNNSSATTTAASAAASEAKANLANLANKACNASDIYIANGNEGNAGKTTTHQSTFKNLPENRNNINNSAFVLAAASEILQQPTKATMLPYQSINNINVPQYNETINDDCGIQQNQYEKLTNTAALKVATSFTSNALAASLLRIPTVPTQTTETTPLGVSMRDYKLQLQQEQQQYQQQQVQPITFIHSSDDDDSAMKCLERKNSSASSGFCTRSGSGNLELELCAMVAAAYEKENANDSASVASDLTRMYVSDEEHEYRVAHYH